MQVSRRKPSAEYVRTLVSRARTTPSPRNVSDAILAIAELKEVSFAVAAEAFYKATGISGVREDSSRGYIPQWTNVSRDNIAPPPAPKVIRKNVSVGDIL